MIRHIMLFNVADDADPQHLLDLLNEFPQNIDFIRSWNVGPHRGGTPLGVEWEYALVCDFDSLDDVPAYHSHPFHVGLIPQLAPMIGALAVADIEIDDATG